MNVKRSVAITHARPRPRAASLAKRRQLVRRTAGHALALLEHLEAQVAVGAADVEAARKRQEAVARLADLSSASTLDVELAEAEVERAEAELRQYRQPLRDCDLRAPYAGRVVTWQALPHETVKAGDEVVEIVGGGPLDVEIIVPSGWLAWLQAGHALAITIEETGAAATAVVDRIGPRVDPVSQTATVYASFVDTVPQLVPGMSGTARFGPAH